MKLLAVAMVLSTLICNPAVGQDKPEQNSKPSAAKLMFPAEQMAIDDFPEHKITLKAFTKAKQLNLKPDTFEWQFRTRYRDAFEQPADFAGKYKVVEWGCGTSCQMVSLINLETGEIIKGFTTSFSVSYQLNNKTFITNPFSEDDIKHGRVTMFPPAKIYYFDGENFNLIKQQKVTYQAIP